MKTILLFYIFISNNSIAYDDTSQCRNIRFADIGWTDVSVVTQVASSILAKNGYHVKIKMLSLPVTLRGMKNSNIDIFLGNWMPAQKSNIQSYLDKGDIEILGQSLLGARYTLGVPAYLYDQGLKSFKDINRFKQQLNGRIYGIEAGNSGNKLVLKMIKENTFDLKGFRLISSSENGMLTAVKSATAQKKAIVFLAWAPHPMNNKFSIKYLLDGDTIFGPNFGESKVNILGRRGFANKCPRLASFFHGLRFTIEEENILMSYVMDKKLSPEKAAKLWIESNPKRYSMMSDLLNDSFVHHKQNIPQNINSKSKIESFFSIIRIASSSLGLYIENLAHFFSKISAYYFILLIPILLFLWKRRIFISLFVFFGLGTIYYLKFWDEMVVTLLLLFLSVFMSSLIGIPLGIYLGHRPVLDKFIDPVLDIMQTLPTFVYLIPTMFIFGLGFIPGIISTIIFATPACVRLTRLGIRSTRVDLINVALSYGATRRQILYKVEWRSARSFVIEGIGQCILLSLSMVVVAALVGAGGLGVPVVRALNTVDLSMGLKAGVCIVILAMIIDRILRMAYKTSNERNAK